MLQPSLAAHWIPAVTIFGRDELLDVKVLSFNIRAWTADQANITVGGTTYTTVTASKDRELREAAIAKTVLDEAPDSFGLQEFNIEFASLFDNGNEKWDNYTDKAFAPDLDKYEFADFPGYAAVGKSNEGDQWIYNPIFYRTDTWDCIEYGTKWLSSTPDVQGSSFYQTTGAYEENSGYVDQSRMVTYAVLRNKSTGEVYVHYNTHLTIARDWLDDQINALNGIINATADGRAFVLTGDMNMDSTWSEYTLACTYWSNASGVAETAVGVTAGMIDFCFIPDGIYVTKFKNMTEVKLKSEWTNGDAEYWVSDHHPIYMEFKLK